MIIKLLKLLRQNLIILEQLKYIVSFKAVLFRQNLVIGALVTSAQKIMQIRTNIGQ